MKPFQILSAFVYALLFSLTANAFQAPARQDGSADAPQATRRIVNDLDRVVLPGNVHPLATPEHRIWRTDGKLPMERIILVLKRRPGADTEMDALIAQQHDPSSPLFHHWLSPEEFEQRFGISDDDVAAVEGWLQSYGFSIDQVTPGRGSINFSGDADRVERAFQTEIDEFMVDGKVYHGNSTNLSIPRALAEIVHGVFSLHDFPSHPAIGRSVAAHPKEGFANYMVNGSRGIVPGDFATIYHVRPLYSSNIDGTGQTIAIVGESNINVNDVRIFRSNFGLSAKDPVVTINGSDPGVVAVDEGEADLDVEWSGAVARNATINLVVTASTNATWGYVLSSQYIVSKKIAPIVSLSYGQCETAEAGLSSPVSGVSRVKFFYNLWSQAVTQGMTVFVAAGDAGAAGCGRSGDKTGSGRGVLAECSTPYNVCVGGTQLNDTQNPAPLPKV
jgi:subtilase family serine protease